MKATLVPRYVTGKLAIEYWMLYIYLPNGDIVLSKRYEHVEEANAVKTLLNQSWENY